MVNMQSVCDRLDAIAGELSVRFKWFDVSPLITLRDESRPSAETNIVVQFEAAIRTVLLTDSVPRIIVFLLSTDGLPRSPQNLLDAHVAGLVNSDNLLARCDLASDGASGPRIFSDPVALWIDDPTFSDELAGAQYGSAIRKVAFEQYPWLADEARQRLADRKLAAKMAELPTLSRPREVFRGSPPVRDAMQEPTTILFALYWLDFGGAESFALRMMEAAKVEGYRVVVVCDEPGRHRVLERAAKVADAIYLLGSYSVGISRDAAMLRIVQQHQPNIIHLHHSWVGYRLLPALKVLGLAPHVLDTTHILEYRFGDFVSESIRYSAYIDQHHVISSDLAEIYTQKAGVPAERVRLGKLHDLSRDFSSIAGKWDRAKPLRVAFIGRFVQQKRPYLFVKVVEQLVRKFGAQRFEFEMVGEGLLLSATQALADRLGVRKFITFLPGTTAVAEVLGKAHILVVCSENEGLTLVGFEAARAEAVVISTDVGAQREIVAQSMLVPRHSLACIQQLVNKVSALTEGQLNAKTVLNEQGRLLASNFDQPTGTAVCLAFYAHSVGEM